MNMRECENQIEWTAFCYVAGELSDEDAARFEEQLAADQSAREALARAVELTQAIAAAESLPAVVELPQRSGRWTKRLSWMAVGAAASLLVAFLWSTSGIGTREHTAGIRNVRELAAYWTETRASLIAESDEVASDIDDAALDLRADGEIASLPETPSWMMAAVVSIADGGSQGEPFEAERREN